MREDRPDDESAAPTPPDAPRPAEADPPGELATPDKSGPRRRRIVLAGAGVVALVVALIVGRQLQHADAPTSGGASGSAGQAALRAGAGPRLPTDVPGPRLTGVIVDGTGAPVVGAEVSCELERGVVDRALATTPGSAGAPGSGSAGVVVVAPVTGPDGRFVLAGLTSGRYRIRVTGPGLLPAEVRYVPVPSDDTRIVVARQVRIDGVVVDGIHKVANAFVGLRGDAIGGVIETRTDSHGAFSFPELPEGRYQLFAWREALAARAMRINRLGAGPFPPIELRLETASIVVGRVIDRDEGIGVVAAIELRPTGDDQAPRYARSGPDGVFRIEGVPSGRWIADAYSPGYTSPGGVELEAGKGVPELALARGATIEGRVLDAEGRPIAGAAVRAIGAGAGTHELSAAVDQDRLRRFSGRIAAPTPTVFVSQAADPQLLPRGELGVLVGPIPPIPPPGVQVARPAAIDPTAAVLAGEPAPLAIDPARASIWLTGADGRYRIRGLPRGKVTALAQADGFAEGRSKQVAVDLAQLIGDVDIPLSAGTILVGKVTDQHGVPVLGAQITARPTVGLVLDAFADDTGTYRLGPVSGRVELVASAYGHGEVRRTLELVPSRGRAIAERREDLVLAVADAILAGTLDDAGGAPVPAATIEVISGAADGRRAVVAPDGTFAIDLLPAGPLRIRVTHPDYPPAELEAMAESGTPAKVRLRLAFGGAVEGVLLDDGGAPVAGIPISGDGPGNATAETTSGPRGQWKLGPLVPGRWTLVVDVPGFVSATQELDVLAARAPGATSVRDVRIDLARGALVGGTVRDGRGQRVAGARITVQRADGSGPAVEDTSDSSGEFRVRDCPAGELSVRAQHGDASGSLRTTVRPGTEILSLSLEIR